ncbi:hypothetical protein F5Y04DRAFT_250543 [Hypomontagnella monticulosa]|nr:hypothetical protein F5Y04DRAFT_250543 [Hypomontagnella monticulosa]
MTPILLASLSPSNPRFSWESHPLENTENSTVNLSLGVLADVSPRLPTSPGLIPPQVDLDCDGVAVHATDEDYERAEELMQKYRDGETQNTRNGDFTYKEATAVLAQIAQGELPNATLGLVQALLEYDADVCFERRRSRNILKLIANKNQEDIRSTLFEDATRNCSSDILRLLAEEADEEALEAALPIAITQDDPEKILILLAQGADASLLCDQFLSAIDRGSDATISALMRRTTGACQTCRDKGLIRAASLGHTKQVQILLKGGANATFDQAAAFQEATRSNRDDIIRIFVSCEEIKQCTPLLDLAVGASYKAKKYQTLEMCLKLGAKGPVTNATLVSAIDSRSYTLADTLIKYGASTEHEAGAAVVSAFMSGQPKVLQMVLNGNPPISSMAAAISHVSDLRDIETAYKMVKLLVSAGIRGDVISEALIQILDRESMAGDQRIRFNLVDLLLKTGQANVNFRRGHCLVLAVIEGWVDILKLLLNHQPSVESRAVALEFAIELPDADLRQQMISMIFDVGVKYPGVTRHLATAIVKLAAKSFRLSVLEAFANHQLSSTVVLDAFSAMISGGEQWLAPRGLEVVQFLLNQGASGPSIDKAFCQAARLMNRDAFELLSTSINTTTPGEALRGIVDHSQEWYSPDGCNLWVVHSLLELGAEGDSVNLAFLSASTAFAQGLASETVLDTLLFVGGADVNFHQGEVLEVAIKAGSVPLLEKVILYHPSREHMARTFSDIIISPLAENLILALLDVLVRGCTSENMPDFKVAPPGRPPPIADCLAIHPKYAALLKRLIGLGCNLEAELYAKIYDDVGFEPVTVLIWALCPLEGNQLVSAATLRVLINAKANVRSTAAFSRTTPLILAARNSRADIVKALIKANADTYVRDCYGRSALFYASRGGDLTTVHELLKAKFKPNDGSLHEAARNLYSDIVAALIKAGHDPNFRSSLLEHEGRTPLQELAYKCDGVRDITEIEVTIAALERGKADALERWRGKNALFLALDHPEPHTITQAMLDIIMWRNINHHNNIIEINQKTGVKYCMSPTMYLVKGSSQATLRRNSQLLHLLRLKNCVDRYYAQQGAEQPPDAVGWPDAI